MITSSIEIDRSHEDVFAYIDQLERHAEWQASLVSSKLETDGPVGVGTRVTDTRRLPGGERASTYEITEHDPPRRSSWRTLDGPVRAVGSLAVEPLGQAGRSRVTVEFDLEGHGIGVVIAPFARRQARKQVPLDQAKLKEILERGA
ncbi:MAG: SRPBCC family protein [Actinomycetota bacterium]|nr:SRPBCC family protein [Actinomycetota bacterium]